MPWPMQFHACITFLSSLCRCARHVPAYHVTPRFYGKLRLLDIIRRYGKNHRDLTARDSSTMNTHAGQMLLSLQTVWEMHWSSCASSSGKDIISMAMQRVQTRRMCSLRCFRTNASSPQCLDRCCCPTDSCRPLPRLVVHCINMAAPRGSNSVA
jgi:hypothetical protein